MTTIFISYRRMLDAYAARLVREKLASRFGRDAVFLDAEAIAPGDNFPQRLDEAIRRSRVFLAIIGKQWLDARTDSGNRCLEDSSDWVRLEIESALSKDLRVIPVLVDGASMPKADDLPKALQPLVTHNALEVRPGSEFGWQFEQLTHAIEKHLGQKTLALLREYADGIAMLPRPVQDIAHVFARRHLSDLVRSLNELLANGVFISMDESAELTRTLVATHFRYVSVERLPLDPMTQWSAGYRKLWESEAAKAFEYVLLVEPKLVRARAAAASITRAADTEAYKMLGFMRDRGSTCYYCDVRNVIDELGTEPPFKEFFEVFDDRIALLMDPLDGNKAQGVNASEPGFAAKKLKLTAVLLHDGHPLLRMLRIIETHRVKLSVEVIERDFLGK